MPQINVSSYADLNTAVASLTTGGTVFIDAPTTLSANLVAPRNVALICYTGNLINHGAYNLQINGPFKADELQVFSGTGSVTFGTRFVHYASPMWWGMDESATDAVNGAALNAAVNAMTPGVLMPNGGATAFNYNQSIVIDRAIKFKGMGSCGTSGTATTSTTWLHYTGTGIAVDLVGSGAEGKENIHLADFMLTGTESAAAGIKLGTGTFVTKGSCKNIKAGGFTKVGARGWDINHCIGYSFENIYGHGNYDGIGFEGANTTLTFNNAQMRSNARKGWYFKNANVVTLLNCLSESNYDEAFCFDGSTVQDVTSISLINCDSENNQRTSGAAPIAIYCASRINVIGGSWTDRVYDTNSPTGRLLYMDSAETCIMDQPGFSTFAPGFALCSTNTWYCVVKVPPTYSIPSNVVNNAFVSGAYRVTITT